MPWGVGVRWRCGPTWSCWADRSGGGLLEGRLGKTACTEKTGGFGLFLVIRDASFIDKMPMVPPKCLYATFQPGYIACISLCAELAKETEKIRAFVKSC